MASRAQAIESCDFNELKEIDLMPAPMLTDDQKRALDLVTLQSAIDRVPSLIPADSGLQFREVFLDLATLAANGSIEFQEAGVELVFSQVGSSPGAVVQLVTGGRLTLFAPGCRFQQPFQGFTVLAGTGCATVGTARFIVVKQNGYRYEEPVTIQSQQSQQLLLGSVDSAGALQFIDIVPDTAPSGASPTGSFDVSGWHAIDVYLNFYAASRATDVKCFFCPRGSTQWFLNQDAFQSLSLDTPVYRQFTQQLWGEPGKLYFMPTNGFGATGFAVRGLF